MQGMDGWFDWYVFRTFGVARHGDQAWKANRHLPPDAADWECRHGACPTDEDKPEGCGCWDG